MQARATSKSHCLFGHQHTNRSIEGTNCVDQWLNNMRTLNAEMQRLTICPIVPQHLLSKTKHSTDSLPVYTLFDCWNYVQLFKRKPSNGGASWQVWILMIRYALTIPLTTNHRQAKLCTQGARCHSQALLHYWHNLCWYEAQTECLEWSCQWPCTYCSCYASKISIRWQSHFNWRWIRPYCIDRCSIGKGILGHR